MANTFDRVRALSPNPRPAHESPFVLRDDSFFPPYGIFELIPA
jgi:hypothetical protein